MGVMKKYEWPEFYNEFAHALLDYKNQRKVLADHVIQIFTKTGFHMPSLTADGTELVDMDPFTVFALFNRKQTYETRAAMTAAIKEIFGLKTAAPKTFDGIPRIDNRVVRFYDVANMKGIDDLWNMFESALAYADHPDESNRSDFIKYFDIAIHIRGNGTGKMTMALYWMAPDAYLNLDNQTETYLTEADVVPDSIKNAYPKEDNKISGAVYLGLLEQVKPWLENNSLGIKSFMDVSSCARGYWFDRNKNSEPYPEPEESGGKVSEDTESVKRKKLSPTIRVRAKEIVDFVYEFDGFEELQKHMELRDTCAVINIPDDIPELSGGRSLYYPFITKDSKYFNTPTDPGERKRYYPGEGYQITIDGQQATVWLSTDWVEKPAESRSSVESLTKVINHWYKGKILIEQDGEDWYISELENESKEVKKVVKDFFLDDLPEEFQKDFGRRYITSLLAKPFVILTGNSGTGKTRIAQRFAQYMEVIDENGLKNWLLVPVGADWTDNTKILGFNNPLANEGQGQYVKTQVLELIERANDHRDIPYFLILDEMNLSHVERYFSDFLSHMETHGLDLILDGLKDPIPYPDNLFVIGTVNIDETTYMFSPKVLDRANVIEFKPEKSDVLGLFSQSFKNVDMEVAPEGEAGGFLKLALEIRSGKCSVESSMDDVSKVFSEIYDKLDVAGFEFAYRTVREIRQYISAAYEIVKDKDKFQLSRALDESLLQKVLPKIYGNRKEIGQLLIDLEEIAGKQKFSRSLVKLKQMKGKLENVQYASFM